MADTSADGKIGSRTLKGDDDEHTGVSKIVSWILRRGAAKAGVQQDSSTKFVKFTDLCAAEVLKDYSSDFIWQVIVDSNGKKLRYEIKEDVPGERLLRAYTSSERTEKGEADTQRSEDKGKGKGKDKGKGKTKQKGKEQDTPVTGVMQNPMDMQMAMYQAMMQNAMNMQMGMYHNRVKQSAAAQDPNRLQGKIKSINTDKGFGFISCQQTFDEHECDVFARAQDLQGFVAGTYVSFACETNKQGKPQASEVIALPMGWVAWGEEQEGKGKGKGKGKDKGKGKGKSKGKGKGKNKNTEEETEKETTEAQGENKGEDKDKEATAA